MGGDVSGVIFRIRVTIMAAPILVMMAGDQPATGGAFGKIVLEITAAGITGIAK